MKEVALEAIDAQSAKMASHYPEDLVINRQRTARRVKKWKFKTLKEIISMKIIRQGSFQIQKL
jgi:hypothetical protein